MIKEIKWKEHPILGNLKLDFTNQFGNICNTIVLAGENGSGKTTVLSLISTFLNLGSFEFFDYIIYEINGIDYKITPDNTSNAQMGFHNRCNLQTNETSRIRTNKNNSPSRIESDLQDIRHYGCVYSKARSGFNTSKIQSSKTSQLDSRFYDDDSNDDFTSIKQLLVDIEAQDNSEWMQICRKPTGETFEEFCKRAKLTRFSNAFNNFFDNIKFNNVDLSNPSEKKIIFEKNGYSVDIDSMSTGEKQIVFRGSHLLKNSRNLLNGTILIDEPELSMHPKWQEKVFYFYKNLFYSNSVCQTQIIMATHSEYVIKSALSNPNDTLVIILSNNNGIIEPKHIIAPTILPSISNAEVNYFAFGISSTDYHNQLYGYLQLKENKTSVKQCDDFIANNMFYNAQIHEKISVNTRSNTTYFTLPTYIRNAIDHPDSGNIYTEDELQTSIELLIDLCK